MSIKPDTRNYVSNRVFEGTKILTSNQIDRIKRSYRKSKIVTLNKRERSGLEYIEKCQLETGVPPSFEEMRVFLGVRSKSQIYRMIKSLEAKDAITRKAGIPRTVISNWIY